MSLTVAIVMMILAWFTVAAAMLWGVLRIARRHHIVPASRKARTERPQKLQAANLLLKA